MLHITFITVGDLPKGAFQEIGDDYKKRLAGFAKLDHRIVKTSENIRIPEGDYLVVLDERGKQVTSHFAAQMLKRIEDEGRHVTIVLGGPKGLPEEIKGQANVLLGLSKMTTTHDLAHLFFLEQLYRACTINHGKTYHY